jgi:hypothetical protein
MPKRKKTAREEVTVRALRTTQLDSVPLYSFFMPGAQVTRVADITRIERDTDDVLKGFQRREIREHVRSIVQYLNQGQAEADWL